MGEIIRKQDRGLVAASVLRQRLCQTYQVFEVGDTCTFWIDISENHQGENAVRFTLIPFN